jgi:hypothetical protein
MWTLFPTANVAVLGDELPIGQVRWLSVEVTVIEVGVTSVIVPVIVAYAGVVVVEEVVLVVVVVVVVVVVFAAR